MTDETLRVKRWRKELKRRAIHEGMARNGPRSSWVKRHEKPAPEPPVVVEEKPVIVEEPIVKLGLIDKLIGLIRRS